MAEKTHTHYKQSRFKSWLRLAALVTLVAFTVNTVLQDYAYAARPSIDSAKIEEILKPEKIEPQPFSIENFHLPEHLGTFSSSEPFTIHHSPSTIIHIRDAHCNYGAQHKIAEIIEYLNTTYGITEINLEGGEGEYDLSIFTNVEDKNIRRKVADSFVKDGELNGAEFYAIQNPDKVHLWGVEDPDLYISNLNAYREVVKDKKRIDKLLKNLSTSLNKQKLQIFSKELLSFEMKKGSFSKNNTDLKEYVRFLDETYMSLRGAEGDAAISKNINLLLNTIDTETKIDFARADKERQEIIDILQRDLSKSELQELVTKVIQFRFERIPAKEFYEYLIYKAECIGVDINNFPNLTSFKSYNSVYESINKTEFFEEIELFEDTIGDKLAVTQEQKNLLQRSKILEVITAMLNFQLTKKDYDYYLENRTVILNERSESKDLFFYIQNSEKFYEYSFKRDKAFLKNIKFTPVNTKNRVSPVIAGSDSDEAISNNHSPFTKNYSLLITGGFHTENLIELMKQQNISYISITPKFDNPEDYESPYFNVLNGEMSAEYQKISQMFGISTIAIASILSPMGEAARGKEEYIVSMLKLHMEIACATGKAGIRVVHGKSERYFKSGWIEIYPSEVESKEEFEIVSLPALAGLTLQNNSADLEKIQDLKARAEKLIQNVEQESMKSRTNPFKGQNFRRFLKETEEKGIDGLRLFVVNLYRAFELWKKNGEQKLTGERMEEMVKIVSNDADIKYINTMGTRKQVYLTDELCFRVRKLKPILALIEGIYGETEADFAELIDQTSIAGKDKLVGRVKELKGFPMDVMEIVIPYDRALGILAEMENRKLLAKLEKAKNSNPLISESMIEETLSYNFGLVLRREYDGKINVYVVAFDLEWIEDHIGKYAFPPDKESALKSIKEANPIPIPYDENVQAIFRRFEEEHGLNEITPESASRERLSEIADNARKRVEAEMESGLEGMLPSASSKGTGFRKQTDIPDFFKTLTFQNNPFPHTIFSIIHEPGHIIAYILTHPISSFFGENRIKWNEAIRGIPKGIFDPPVKETGGKGAFVALGGQIWTGLLSVIFSVWSISIIFGVSHMDPFSFTGLKITLVTLIAVMALVDTVWNAYKYKDKDSDWQKAKEAFRITDHESRSTSDGLDGLCLTPDSLISLPNGTQKPLIELNVGEDVLSLNQETNELEPHRVNALLDMGIKPVYKITTSSGKQLKTTLNHPYLTKDGWKKLKDIGVGEEITAVKSSEDISDFNVFDENVKHFYVYDSSLFPKPVGRKPKSEEEALNQYSFYLPPFSGNTHTDNQNKENRANSIDIRCLGGMELNKSAVNSPKHTIIQLSILAAINSLLASVKNVFTGTFPSANIAQFCLGVNAVFKFAFSIVDKYSISNFSSQDKFNIHKKIFANMSESIRRFFSTQTAYAEIVGVSQNVSFVIPGESVISSESVIPSEVERSKNFNGSRVDTYNTPLIPDTTWDKIVSIEYLGKKHVYDIEVDGTHNFVAEGIVAHNTYSQGLGGRTEGIEGKSPSHKKTGLKQWLTLSTREKITYFYQKFHKGFGFISILVAIDQILKTPIRKILPVSVIVSNGFLDWRNSVVAVNLNVGTKWIIKDLIGLNHVQHIVPGHLFGAIGLGVLAISIVLMWGKEKSFKDPAFLGMLFIMAGCLTQVIDVLFLGHVVNWLVIEPLGSMHLGEIYKFAGLFVALFGLGKKIKNKYFRKGAKSQSHGSQDNSGNLIGKLFDDKRNQIKTGIYVNEEDGWLVFYHGDNEPLYTKDDEKARVELRNKIDNDAETGYAVRLIKDNDNIRGFADPITKTIYLSERLKEHPVVLSHEKLEMYYALNPNKLPTVRIAEKTVKLNAHIYIRGCGKDVRSLLRNKRISGWDANILINYLKQNLPERRHNEEEFYLIRYNASKGKKGIELIYGCGLQDNKRYKRKAKLSFEKYAIEKFMRDVDGYIKRVETNLSESKSRLAQFQGSKIPPLISKEEQIVERNQENLEKAMVFRQDLVGIVRYKKFMEILRKHSSSQTEHQRKVLEVITRVIPGFSKESVLFVNESFVLARIYNFSEKLYRGMCILLAEDRPEYLGIVLLSTKISTTLELVLTLSHEEWHRRTPLRGYLGGIINEGMTTYLQKQTVKRILIGKSEIAKLIKKEFGPVDFVFDTLGRKSEEVDELLETLIGKELNYKRERMFVEKLMEQYGEEFMMKVFLSGKVVSLLREKIGERADLINAVASIERENLPAYNKWIIEFLRFERIRLMRTILDEPSFDRKLYESSKTILEIIAEVIESVEFNSMIYELAADKSEDIYASVIGDVYVTNFITEYGSKLANQKNDSDEVLTQLEKDIYDIRDRALQEVQAAHGNLIGKLFRNQEGTDQIKTSIKAEEKDGWLVFYHGVNEPLYTKDGKEAKVRLTDQVRNIDGQTIRIIEDNIHIRGFGGVGEVQYLCNALLDEKVALYHEKLEAEYAKSRTPENLPELPEGVNAHTYLRGVGRDVRKAYKQLIADGSKPDQIDDVELLISALNEKITKPERRVTDEERALVEFNIVRGVTDIERLYGEQDRVFGVDENEGLTEEIGKLKNLDVLLYKEKNSAGNSIDEEMFWKIAVEMEPFVNNRAELEEKFRGILNDRETKKLWKIIQEKNKRRPDGSYSYVRDSFENPSCLLHARILKKDFIDSVLEGLFQLDVTGDGIWFTNELTDVPMDMFTDEGMGEGYVVVMPGKVFNSLADSDKARYYTEGNLYNYFVVTQPLIMSRETTPIVFINDKLNNRLEQAQKEDEELMLKMRELKNEVQIIVINKPEELFGEQSAIMDVLEENRLSLPGRDCLPSMTTVIFNVLRHPEMKNITGKILKSKRLEGSGNLIGKLFRAQAGKNQIKTGITAEEKEIDGADWLVFYAENGKDTLYTKDGKEAKVQLVNKEIIGVSGQTIRIFKDNKYIRGFGSSPKLQYLCESLVKNKIAQFHEKEEAAYASGEKELPPNLPKTVNAHTFLRGVGKDVRKAYQELINDEQNPKGMMLGRLLPALNSRMINRQITAEEEALIKYNVAKGAGNKTRLYGMQDRKFKEEENKGLTERIGRLKNLEEKCRHFFENDIPATFKASGKLNPGYIIDLTIDAIKEIKRHMGKEGMSDVLVFEDDNKPEERKTANITTENWGNPIVVPISAGIDIFTDESYYCPLLIMRLRDKDGQENICLSHVSVQGTYGRVEKIIEALEEKGFIPEEVIFSPNEGMKFENIERLLSGFLGQKIIVINKPDGFYRKELVSSALVTDEGWVIIAGNDETNGKQRVYSGLWKADDNNLNQVDKESVKDRKGSRTAFEEYLNKPLLSGNSMIANELVYLFQLFGNIELRFVSSNEMNKGYKGKSIVVENSKDGRRKRIVCDDKITAEDIINLIGKLREVTPSGYLNELGQNIYTYFRQWENVFAGYSGQHGIPQNIAVEMGALSVYFRKLADKTKDTMGFEESSDVLSGKLFIEDDVKAFIDNKILKVFTNNMSRQKTERRIKSLEEFFVRNFTENITNMFYEILNQGNFEYLLNAVRGWDSDKLENGLLKDKVIMDKNKGEDWVSFAKRQFAEVLRLNAGDARGIKKLHIETAKRIGSAILSVVPEYGSGKFHIENMLEGNKANCVSYATMFCIIAREIGLDARKTSVSYAYKSFGYDRRIGHAANLIRLPDGDIVVVDITWSNYFSEPVPETAVYTVQSDKISRYIHIPAALSKHNELREYYDLSDGVGESIWSWSSMSKEYSENPELRNKINERFLKNDPNNHRILEAVGEYYADKKNDRIAAETAVKYLKKSLKGSVTANALDKFENAFDMVTIFKTSEIIGSGTNKNYEEEQEKVKQEKLRRKNEYDEFMYELLKLHKSVPVYMIVSEQYGGLFGKDRYKAIEILERGVREFPEVVDMVLLLCSIIHRVTIMGGIDKEKKDKLRTRAMTVMETALYRNPNEKRLYAEYYNMCVVDDLLEERYVPFCKDLKGKHSFSGEPVYALMQYYFLACEYFSKLWDNLTEEKQREWISRTDIGLKMVKQYLENPKAENRRIILKSMLKYYVREGEQVVTYALGTKEDFLNYLIELRVKVPESVAVIETMAIVLMGLKKYEEAANIMEEYLSKIEYNLDIRKLFLICLSKIKGREREIIIEANKILDYDHDNFNALALLGKIYQYLGRYKEAVRHYEKYLFYYNNPLRSRSDYGEYSANWVQERLGECKRALDRIEEGNQPMDRGSYYYVKNPNNFTFEERTEEISILLTMLMSKIRFPKDKTIILMPKPAGDDSVELFGEVMKGWKLVREGLEDEYGMGNIRVRFYADTDDKNIEKVFEKTRKDLEKGGVYALAYARDTKYGSISGKIEKINMPDRIKCVREKIDNELILTMISMHVVLGLGLIDYVKNHRDERQKDILVGRITELLYILTGDQKFCVDFETDPERIFKGGMDGLLLRIEPYSKKFREHMLAVEEVAKSL